MKIYELKEGKTMSQKELREFLLKNKGKHIGLTYILPLFKDQKVFTHKHVKIVKGKKKKQKKNWITVMEKDGNITSLYMPHIREVRFDKKIIRKNRP